ncbi:MAG: EamA family transporter [candidate division Zixibacteria bacterium]|nr:EamA family transporter [candidate division Zixibacteria bacterium]MDH3937268.1 EamA family transporter [candidate division Zixibacteria bacterium]MDH4033197.1 EamA family transporter [candidate division Zixibacteria bacterium]
MSEHMKFKIALGFAAIYIIWGSTYLAIRLGVGSIPPFMMAGIRFMVGGLIMYTWMRARGVAAPSPKHWWTASVIGTLLAAGGTGLVTWAETTVPSGLTALLVAMVPMWIVLVDWLRPNGIKPRRLVVAGLGLGFFGVALLINPTDIGGVGEIDKFGALLIVLATMSWAIGSVYSRHAEQPSSKLLGASMQMLVGGGVLLLASALTGEFNSYDVGATTLESWMALTYLITVGSGAFAVYIWLIGASTPSKVATYAFVNPVIALVLGALVAGEALSGWTFFCSVIVILAVFMIIRSKARAAQPTNGAVKFVEPPVVPIPRFRS